MLTGQCNCGAVRFEITEPLVAAAYCHCTRCQRRTGTATQASAVLAPGSLKLLQGEDVLRGWWAGDGGEKVFCSVCGSHVFARNHDTQEPYAVRLGVIDGDPGVRPQGRVHVSSAAMWEPIPDDGLPRLEGGLGRPADQIRAGDELDDLMA
ncbi:MAG TPA: GFA family protein [Baekduia sp.]|nr:GFA family protein [Baekduia sp.]